MNRYKCLSSTSIKLIAIITMLIDHFAAGVLYMLIVKHGMVELRNTYYVCRYIGRPAFPIFCYILVEGYLYTKNVSQYLFRLFLFGIISEIPFDMTIKRTYLEYTHQNVFFTLSLGLLAIWCIDYFYHNYRINSEMRIIVAFLGSIIFTSISYYGKTDYAGIGVVIIIAIYLCRNIPMIPILVGPFFLMVWEYTKAFFEQSSKNRYFEVAAILSIPVLLLYNGKRGRYSFKWFFYLFYPLHLLIIGFICMRYLNG